MAVLMDQVILREPDKAVRVSGDLYGRSAGAADDLRLH